MESSKLKRLAAGSLGLGLATLVTVTACNDIAPPFNIDGTGGVEGQVFFDASEDGIFDPSDGDFAIQGVGISLQVRGTGQTLAGGATSTGADGRFTLSDIAVGTHDLSIDTSTVPAGVAICQNPVQVSIFENETRFKDVAGRPGCLITIAEAKDGPQDAFVVVRGVVTSSPGQIEARRTYIQDATAGTLIFSGGLAGQSAVPIEIGDQIEIGGTTTNFSNDFELVNPILRELVKGVGALAPRLVTTDEIASSGADFSNEIQGLLVTIAAAELLDVFGCGTCGSSRNAPFDDGTGQAIARIDAGVVSSSADIMTTALPGGATLTVGNCYDITGFGANFNGQGQIFPRSIDDIVEVACN